MVFNQAVGAFGLKQKRESQICCAFCRGDGVKSKRSVGGKALHGARTVSGSRHARRSWRQLAQKGFGQGQYLWRKCLDHGSERLALLGSQDDLRSPLPVATNGVPIVEPAYDLGCGLNLIAMQQVEWYQRVFHLCGGHSGTNVVFTEALERRGANFEDTIQFVGGIGAVVPQVRDG